MKTLLILLLIIAPFFSKAAHAEEGVNLESSYVSDKTIEFIAANIRNYLTERPDAADTVEGVHGWWIIWPGLPESILCTQAALELLEKDGFVEQVPVGNRTIWRKARSPISLL